MARSAMEGEKFSRSLPALSAVILAALLAAGCGGLVTPGGEGIPTPMPEATEPAAPQAGGEEETSAADLEGRTWTLVSYGSPDNPQTVAAGSSVTATFDLAAGQVGGSAGCNSYSGGIAVDGSSLSMTSPMAVTMMACADGGLMDQETQFLAILAAAQSYTIEGGLLQITASDGQELTFTMPGEAGSPGGPAIAITGPQDGAVLDLSQPVHIEGTGEGLFEGALIVEIRDADGSVLVGQPTIMQGEDVGVGEPGVWAVDLVVEAVPGANGQIVAYAASPRDGSIVASDSVEVTFGGQ